MPLPKPRKGQSKKEFISQCAGNKVMNKEFPDTSQRLGVCFSLWSHKKSKAGYVISAGDDEYIIDETDYDDYNPLDKLDDDKDLTPDQPSDTDVNKTTYDPPVPETSTKPAPPPDETKSSPESKKSPINSTGLDPNPDNSTNPHYDRMQWYLGDEMDEKLKDSYIADIENDQEEMANWPLDFKKIEKHFDRPNKTKEDSVENHTDPNKVEKIDHPFVM